MPRKLRLQYPGAMYHIMSRGDRQEKIFLTDVDRHDFLKTLAETCQKTGWRVLKTGERLLPYPWSSFGAYLASAQHRPGWIRVDRLLGEHGIQRDHAEARQQFEARMEQRRTEEADLGLVKALRRGWYLGGEDFRRDLVSRMTSELREHHAGDLHRASGEAKAQEILAHELKRRGLREKDLPKYRKNDPAKLEIAPDYAEKPR